MALVRKCPRCGTEVEGETLDGLCPECLFGEGLVLENADELAEGPAGVTGVLVPAPGTSRRLVPLVRRVDAPLVVRQREAACAQPHR